MSNPSHKSLYKLVEFADELTPDGRKSTDCIPSSWVSYSEEFGSCVAKYMNPPYNEEDSKLLNTLIRDGVRAPDSWPEYHIYIRGEADTYKEGIKKLKLLEMQTYTTDSESRGMEKMKKIEETFKSQAEISNMLQITTTRAADRRMPRHRNSTVMKETEFDSSESDEEYRPPIKPLKNGNKVKKNLRAHKILQSEKAPLQYSGSSDDHHDGTNIEEANCGKGQKDHHPVKKQNKNYSLSVEKSTGHSAKDTSGYHQKIASTLSASTSKKFDKKAVDVDDIAKEKRSVVNYSKNVENTASRESNLLYIAIKKLTVEISEMRCEINSMRNSMERNSLVKINDGSIVTFLKKYQIQQLTTEEEFRAFDEDLQKNEEFEKDFKEALKYLLESSMKNTVINIIKKFLRRDFAMNCTAIKQMSNKYVLKGSRFYDILFEFICQVHKAPDGGILTEKLFYQALSSSPTNSKDWDGNRKFRTTKKHHNQE